MKNNISSQNTKINTKEDAVMIIMDLKFDNFLGFQNFHMNMSYPRKIKNSYIQKEYLTERENFRYKKVNVLIGANATGKTSIGKMLMAIFNFIHTGESVKILNKVSDESREASLSVDFVVNEFKMYRLDVVVYPKSDESSNLNMGICTRVVDIAESDRYETCAEKIDMIPLRFNLNFSEELDKIERLGWLFLYPFDTSDGKERFSDDSLYAEILEYTLRILDPAIKKVEKLNTVKDSYVIRTNTQDIIIQDGDVIKNSILSSGTKSGISIASMISGICEGTYGFYYCDEKFAYVHSDIEKAFLNLMIDKLHENQQLFFTTHNLDILDMQFPKHTFTFLKKDVNDAKEPIKCVNAATYLKRSTDSVRCAFENDLFSVAPDLELFSALDSL